MFGDCLETYSSNRRILLSLLVFLLLKANALRLWCLCVGACVRACLRAGGFACEFLVRPISTSSMYFRFKPDPSTTSNSVACCSHTMSLHEEEDVWNGLVTLGRGMWAARERGSSPTSGRERGSLPRSARARDSSPPSERARDPEA